MKLRTAVTAILCIGLVCSVSIQVNQASAQGRKAASTEPQMPKITVLNPMGTPPPVQLQQPAPRLTSLEGKTLYFVNTGYHGTDRLMEAMSDWLKANYPKTNVVIRRSRGGMAGVEKELWAEIAEKGDAAILGLGH